MTSSSNGIGRAFRGITPPSFSVRPVLLTAAAPAGSVLPLLQGCGEHLGRCMISLSPPLFTKIAA